jgi:hypothetical protein
VRFYDPGMEDWVPCVSPEGRFLLERPGWWEVSKDQGALVLVAPDTGAGFRAQVVLAREPGVPEAPLEQVTGDRLDQLSGALDDFQLIDRAPAVLSSKPAQRVLIACREHSLSVTIEQWWAVTPSGVLSVSAVAPTMEYDAFADVFAHVAATLQVTEHD